MAETEPKTDVQTLFYYFEKLLGIFKGVRVW